MTQSSREGLVPERTTTTSTEFGSEWVTQRLTLHLLCYLHISFVPSSDAFTWNSQTVQMTSVALCPTDCCYTDTIDPKKQGQTGTRDGGAASTIWPVTSRLTCNLTPPPLEGRGIKDSSDDPAMYLLLCIIWTWPVYFRFKLYLKLLFLFMNP